MARHNELGKWGEKLAEEILISEGFAIAERNWRMGHLEIDLIAMRDDIVVFAEVKSRSNRDEDPLEAIDKRKIAHMVRAAEAYMNFKNLPHGVRFDVFGISGTPEDYTIEHIPDAFFPPLKTYR
ncbi:MAG: YraN family protein [Muribaculaceae bacterium]|nr:YraN family protein [Muribaculaceae bacterium]